MRACKWIQMFICVLFHIQLFFVWQKKCQLGSPPPIQWSLCLGSAFLVFILFLFLLLLLKIHHKQPKLQGPIPPQENSAGCKTYSFQSRSFMNAQESLWLEYSDFERHSSSIFLRVAVFQVSYRYVLSQEFHSKVINLICWSKFLKILPN